MDPNFPHLLRLRSFTTRDIWSTDAVQVSFLRHLHCHSCSLHSWLRNGEFDPGSPFQRVSRDLLLVSFAAVNHWQLRPGPQLVGAQLIFAWGYSRRQATLITLPKLEVTRTRHLEHHFIKPSPDNFNSQSLLATSLDRRHLPDWY